MGGRGSSSMGSGAMGASPKANATPTEALEKMGFTVGSGFGTLDGDYQKQVAERLGELEAEFGVVSKFGGTIQASNLGARTNALVRSKSYRDPAHDQMLMFNNRDTAAERDRAARRSTSTGWYMPYDQDKYTGVQRTATHEYGHMLQNVMIYNSGSRDGSSFKATATAHKREILRIARSKYGLPKGALKFGAGSISEYGTKNQFEFFAEAFANSQLGQPNAIGLATREFLAKKRADGLF